MYAYLISYLVAYLKYILVMNVNLNIWIRDQGVRGEGSPVYSSSVCEGIYTDKYSDIYIRRRYIPRLLYRLTDEYNVYSSIIEVYLSVITDKPF
jgi:hypothetical protein